MNGVRRDRAEAARIRISRRDTPPRPAAAITPRELGGKMMEVPEGFMGVSGLRR